MRVAVTGSTGLIGEGLVELLDRDGHDPVRVVRSRDRVVDDEIYWSVEAGEIDAGAFEAIDAVVHLAGEPLDASRRTTARHRRAVYTSRVEGTRLLAEALAGLDEPPEVLVSQSGVDYYGDRGQEILTEDAAPGDTFMARVCRDWEAAARPAADAGIRVANPRTGIVIASSGPLMDKVRLPFSLGLGGPVLPGDQYYPWISLEDEVRVLEFLVEGELAGPVNSCGPAPVTNIEFTRALGEVMGRPTLLPIPALAIRLLYGQLGAQLAVESKRTLPQRLLEAGFSFRHATVRSALGAAL